jgi:Transglutaminase-like superfamily
MKKLTLFLAFSTLLGTLMAQTAADPAFASFASYQDSLMRNAYQQRDITHYRQLLATFLVRYRRLDSTSKMNYSGYHAGAWYNLSCTYALTHQDKPALDCLDSAVKAGWTDYNHTVVDEDLTGLHDNPRFTELLRPLKERYDYGYVLGRAGLYNNADARPIPAFYYQPASDPNLTALRKGLNLDSIAGGGDDVTRVLHLMHWMHDLIPHDGTNGNPAVKNAMSMIAVCRQNHGTLNCRGLAITLNECLLSLGYHSRYVTCLPKDSLGVDNDCHVIDMVFIPKLHKWIWVDPTFDAYVMNENGEPLGLEEVRQRLVDHLPLILNPDANWNHRNGQSKEAYLYGYMSKNLYRLMCSVNSTYDLETNSPGKSVAYVELLPLDYFRQAPDKESYAINGNGHQYVYHTNNASAFWAAP